MSTPSFGGNAVFGLAPVLTTRDVPRERQVNAYFGLSGVESLDGGSRGMETLASGVLIGPGESGLRQAVAFFRSLKDGNAYTLIDTLGGVWPDVILTEFNPLSPVHSTPGGYRWCRYEAKFVHLTEP